MSGQNRPRVTLTPAELAHAQRMAEDGRQTINPQAVAAALRLLSRAGCSSTPPADQ